MVINVSEYDSPTSMKTQYWALFLENYLVMLSDIPFLITVFKKVIVILFYMDLMMVDDG